MKAKKDYFGEGRNIEFKQMLPTRHEKFLKDIIAFSNCSGGKVIVGIADDSGEVVGIGDRSPFKLADDIANMISDACEPQIEPDISVQSLEGETVLVVNIFPGKFRPYYLKSVGKEASTYIRISGTSRTASERKIRELELEGRRICYDTMQEIGQNYDEKKALQLCKSMREEALSTCHTDEDKSAIKEMTIQKLEDFGVLCRVGGELSPTHAFALMTDNKVRYAKIQCARFKGTQRDIFIDKREFDGPIYKQVEEAYQFVLKHINLGAEIEGIHTRDVYELPQWAIREMIANAVVHRSYLVESCVQVSVYDDRVEVDSPGMLYDGLDLNDVRRGTSRCRNAAIAESFHYMKIIDSWGTGIPRIVSNCREYGLREPTFEEFGDGFKITMFRRMDNVGQNSDITVSKKDSAASKTSSSASKTNSTASKTSSSASKMNSTASKTSSHWSKYETRLQQAGITKTYIASLRAVFGYCAEDQIFRQADIMVWLDCSKSKATNIIKCAKQAGIIEMVRGMGLGRYRFIKKI